MHKFTLLALGCLLCGVSACAPQHHASAPTPPANLSPLEVAPDDAGIAMFLGAAVEGERRVFNSSRFGQNITVTAGRTYLSAYGIPCREGLVQGRRRVAACQQMQRGKEAPMRETWALAPDIMDNGQY